MRLRSCPSADPVVPKTLLQRILALNPEPDLICVQYFSNAHSPYVSPKSRFGEASVVSQDSPRGAGGADHQLFAGAKGPGEGYGAPGHKFRV